MMAVASHGPDFQSHRQRFPVNPGAMGVFSSVLFDQLKSSSLPSQFKKKKTKIANDFPHKFPNASPPYPPPPLVKTEQNTPCHFLKAFFYYYLDWHLSVGLVCPAHQYGSSRFHPPFRYKLYKVPRIVRARGLPQIAPPPWPTERFHSPLALDAQRVVRVHDCKLVFR